MSDTPDTPDVPDTPDTPDTPDVPDTPAAADTPAPADSSSSASPAEADDDVFGDLADDQAVFDRGYVDKMRREGARYRVEAREAQQQLDEWKEFQDFREALSSYAPDDQRVWYDMISGWLSDEQSAARMMGQISTAILGEGGDTANADPDADPDAPATDGPMTSEQVQKLIQEEANNRDAARAQAAAVESVYQEIRDAGFDPKSRDGFAILWTANNETDADVGKAIEKFKADRQKIVDDYVSGRAAGKHAAPAPNDGVVASAHTPIQNLDDARRAAEEYMKAQVGNS